MDSKTKQTRVVYTTGLLYIEEGFYTLEQLKDMISIFEKRDAVLKKSMERI